ncbi:MAG: class I SAM-dependent methyltransferase, partial [Anaerolineae bacterium]
MTTPVCDYEGSDYRTRFWENQGREYEDLTERIAIQRMMPPNGDTVIDLGAGFGRLANEYDGYQRVVLMDYSSTLLGEARERLGDDPRFIFVAADWYKMPFVDNLFDTMVQVRTIHHAADVPALFSQLKRIIQPKGNYILEFANKLNLKAILRYWLGKQDWNPFTHDPIEFVELNFDFHPTYIKEQLSEAQFNHGRILTTSHFRIGFLKRTVPIKLLVWLDSIASLTGPLWQLTPSVFVHSTTSKSGTKVTGGAFFACPECVEPLTEKDGKLPCSCGKTWEKKEGIY